MNSEEMNIALSIAKGDMMFEALKGALYEHSEYGGEKYGNIGGIYTRDSNFADDVIRAFKAIYPEAFKEVATLLKKKEQEENEE